MAERSVDDARQCPTRTDGVHPLIAHRIRPGTCLERQRRNYHKCFTCEYRGLPAEARLAPPAPIVEAPLAAAPAVKARSKSKIEKASA